MVSDEMVEIAARAMCEAWCYAPIGTPDGDAEWKRKQDQYRKQARAALSAIVDVPVVEAEPVRAIPRADNCGRYLAEVNDGKLLYLNHANQWQECPNFIRDALADARVTKSEPVAWQWRSRIKGGAWDAWENGRYGQQVPPFMDVAERPLYAHPPLALRLENEALRREVGEVRAKVIEECIAKVKDYALDAQPDSEYALACNDIVEAFAAIRSLGKEGSGE